MREFLVVVIGAVALAGCKYNKETVPVRRAEADVRVPNQQRVVALATDQAVEALDLSKLQGKTVAIEVSGVFPHSQDDLLAYLTAQVEAKLSRAGARVQSQPPLVVVAGAQPGAAPPLLPAQGALALTEPPDYRLLVDVSWGGADVREKVITDEPLLTKQIGLAAGGIVGGVVLDTISDTSFRQTFATLGAAVAVAGAAIWYWKKTPFPRVTTLLGRVRILAQAIPTKEGVSFTTEGVGESKIINDDRSPEGYMVVR
ncbi:MAG TPA: hypothetical protein VGF94_24715 [Kofleriaceae bacterium]|jgi:hypothetical protein